MHHNLKYLEAMKKTILTLLLMAVMAFSSAAGDLTWGKYNINFSVPDGGFVTLNTPTRFAEQWDEMSLSIDLYAKADEKQNKDIYYSTLRSKAEGYNMYDLQQSKVKVKGFKGYQVEGTMPDGTRCLLVNLVSKKTNLVVQITVNYLFGNREAVDDLVKSFAENKEQKANHDKKRQKVQSPEAAKQQQKKQKPTQEQLNRQRKQQEQELRRKGELHDI